MGVDEFEAAHAGAAIGPSAIVKAIRKAINFLGLALV
jgi:Na+-translocating ferredoxin:NAD+ oxidoreductase RnfG subunit